MVTWYLEVGDSTIADTNKDNKNKAKIKSVKNANNNEYSLCSIEYRYNEYSNRNRYSRVNKDTKRNE